MKATAMATISMALIIFTIFSTGVKGEEINTVMITSEKQNSNIRLYAKENATSYIYQNITIHIITNSNNSTALIYFNSILKDAFNFSYETERRYTINETTKSISVIVNNRTHKFYVNVLRNINLDNYINNKIKKLKYTESDLQRIIESIKISMLEKITVGFLIGFIAVAIYLVRRLRNEIQPVL